MGDQMEVNLKKDTYAAALQHGLLMGKDLDLADAGYRKRPRNPSSLRTGRRRIVVS